MKATRKNTRIAILSAAFAAGSSLGLAADSQSAVLQTDTGTVTFESATNMPGIEVKGKSGALSARVQVSWEAGKLLLHEMEATVPVKTLATGMKVRDEQMRQYIFRTSDGAEPDLRFTGSSGVCEVPPGGREFLCHISGALTIRGIAKTLTLNVRAK